MKIKTVIILSSLIFVVFISGCTSNQEQVETYNQEQVETYQSLFDEYQRHFDAIEDDARDLEEPLNKWNILMEQWNKGGTIDITDFEQAQRDYADKSNIIKPKIESLKSFIDANEAQLKEAGLDTFQAKQDLDERLAAIQNNARNMQTEIEKDRNMQTEIEQVETYQSLFDEYSRYVDAIEDDARDLEEPLNKWSILVEQWNKGGTIDITDLEQAQRDYADKSNIIKPKIESLKSFIDANEAQLKEAGSDTFQEKQDLDEMLAAIQNNARNMQTEIEKFSG